MWICVSSSAIAARTLSHTNVLGQLATSLQPVAGFLVPDVLVLAGGGVLGEAWMTGVLAGIEDETGIDLRRTEAFVGTSAGAIVAAGLAAGRSPRRPPNAAGAQEHAAADMADASPGAAMRDALRTLGAWGWAATAPAAAAALALGTPGGALVRSAVLARMPAGTRRLDRLHAELERTGARFDGRLRVCCVERRSGRRVVFGAPGAPGAGVADAVTASCAVPWLFEPVDIAGREYVDGGVWSVTNLDAAPAGRDTQVLCLDTIAGLRGSARGPLQAVRAASRVTVELETQLLRRRGARVAHVMPDGEAAQAIGTDLMAAAPAAQVLATGFRQGRALAAR
jgi:NTE family protein